MLKDNIINKKCVQRNLTPYALSKKAEISPTYAYKLYRNEMSNPSAKILDKVAWALGCSARDLLV